MKTLAKESHDYLSNDSLVEEKIQELMRMVDAKYPWSLDLAMSLYDYKVVKEKYGDILRTLMAYMIVFNYHSKLDPVIKGMV